jgi:hypothetical protein
MIVRVVYTRTKLGEKEKMTIKKEKIKKNIRKNYEQTRIKFALMTGA